MRPDSPCLLRTKYKCTTYPLFWIFSEQWTYRLFALNFRYIRGTMYTEHSSREISVTQVRWQWVQGGAPIRPRQNHECVTYFQQQLFHAAATKSSSKYTRTFCNWKYMGRHVVLENSHNRFLLYSGVRKLNQIWEQENLDLEHKNDIY